MYHQRALFSEMFANLFQSSGSWCLVSLCAHLVMTVSWSLTLKTSLRKNSIRGDFHLLLLGFEGTSS